MNVRSPSLVVAIGVFKLVKATLLVVIATAALLLVHHDPAGWLARRAMWLHIDPHHRMTRALLRQVGLFDGPKLVWIGLASYAYAAVFAIEGVGLVKRRHWAEWLTICVTASFMPFEVYELWRRVTPPRAIALVVNALIVVYLVWRRAEKSC